MPMTRAAADLLLEDIELAIQQRAATLNDSEFRVWFSGEGDSVMAVTSDMHHEYFRERLAKMLASVGKSPL
jgi:hypothetical protein